MTKLTRRKELLSKLASFLTENQMAKSVQLEVEMSRHAGDPRPQLAREWAELRAASGVQGYPTYDEAMAVLTELFTND